MSEDIELKSVEEFFQKHHITHDVQFLGVFPRDGWGDHEVANYRITLTRIVGEDERYISTPTVSFVVKNYSCGLGVPAREFVLTGSRNGIMDGSASAGRVISKAAAEEKKILHTGYNPMWRTYEKNYRIAEAMKKLERQASAMYEPPLIDVFMSLVLDARSESEFITLQDYVDTFGIDVNDVQSTIDAYRELQEIGPKFINWLGGNAAWDDLNDNYDLEW